MWEHFLIIVHLLASDVRLPFQLNGSLAAVTESFVPEVHTPVVAGPHAFSAPEPAPLPIASSKKKKHTIQADRALLLDADSAEVLFAKNADEPAPVASIVKLATALVTLEQAESLDQVLTVPKSINGLEEASTIAGFKVGEKVDVETLLEALLVASANDAALTLAEGLAGSEKKFVALMNEKAAELGLSNTTFANATGLDAEKNQSTARDVAFLLKSALREPLIRQYTSQNDATIRTANGNSYYLKATNKLLSESDLEIVGGKTGNTDLAGASVVVMARAAGRTMIAVILSSQDRFGEAQSLVQYGAEQFVWPGSVGETRFAEEKETDFGG
jgi:D-alanyl-D-alanine carboxypeptidase (penicillin-binding protein 5/6)